MNDRPSAHAPDWQRERKRFFEWAPGRSLLASVRSYQHHARGGRLWSPWLRRCAAVRHALWQVVTGAFLPLNTRVDGGLQMPHPQGIVVHPEARIGPNCTLMQQVTLGVRSAHDNRVPTLLGDVDVGAGAKLLGGITIGNHVTIGANAVVVTDVPDNSVAVGVPARVLPRGASNATT